MNRDAPTLGAVARAWGRIGIVGFGGPPAHIALLRELVVDRRRWMRPERFEDGLAAVNLLPGPASSQLAIYTAWRVRGPAGALVGGLAFVVPGLVLIVALAALFLGAPPDWIRGAGAGAGAAVAAVAIHAGLLLVRPAWDRAPSETRSRFVVYAVLGGVSAATLGPWLVAVLIACGFVEVGWRRLAGGALSVSPFAAIAVIAASSGTFASLAWVAFKVGALSYGGGFVIIPLMQADAVERYGWMTETEFLNAVALGQVTPGPVTHTVAVVGYAAAGVP
ncbi:MAG: chromate transporter, partial [Gaiellaceae bacterium]